MRIIAGALSGHRLRSPRGRATRPTSDRVREALFSALGPIDDARVLDLFAGSGALGIEALSRGAGCATFVDAANAPITTIRSNLEKLGLRAEVVKQPAEAFLARAEREQRQYDLVFVDPPYGLAIGVGERLSATLPAILAPAAQVVVESDRRAPLALDMALVFERRYGDTLIRIYE